MTAVRQGLGLAALLFALLGCDLGIHRLSGPLEDRVVCAESGDRFYLCLDEPGIDSPRWTAVCDDGDVDVSIDHRKDTVKAEIRVHRGFDGPATVTFRRRPVRGVAAKEFVVMLYKRTGDAAFWE